MGIAGSSNSDVLIDKNFVIDSGTGDRRQHLRGLSTAGHGPRSGSRTIGIIGNIYGIVVNVMKATSFGTGSVHPTGHGDLRSPTTPIANNTFGLITVTSGQH